MDFFVAKFQKFSNAIPPKKPRATDPESPLTTLTSVKPAKIQNPTNPEASQKQAKRKSTEPDSSQKKRRVEGKMNKSPPPKASKGPLQKSHNPNQQQKTAFQKKKQKGKERRKR